MPGASVLNLHVADASFMPTSTGINPSLTIAANALRVADAICAELGSSDHSRGRVRAAGAGSGLPRSGAERAEGAAGSGAVATLEPR